MSYLVLPGLDGTGDLLARFAELSGARVLVYPPDRELTSDEYLDYALPHVDDGTILIGESFSGPIAIRIAAMRRVRGLVLAGTFVKWPKPRALKMLPLASLGKVRIAQPVQAAWLLMPRPTMPAFRALRRVFTKVDAKVLASRMRIALSADERATLARTTCPLLDLRPSNDWMVARRQRRYVLAARPDAATADVKAPHTLLLCAPEAAWEVIRAWSATIADGVRPSAAPI